MSNRTSWRARAAADFAAALSALLPQGPVWPRHQDSALQRLLKGLGGLTERWAHDAWVFLTYEAFPPDSVALLSDWERVLGLPEPCIPSPQTDAERRLAVMEKLQRRPGSQSRAYYIEIARRLGYHFDGPAPSMLQAELGVSLGSTPQVRIREYAPFQFGVSRLGVHVFPGTTDPRWQLGGPHQRFYWRMSIPGARLNWFRFGTSRLGQDPHLRIRRAEDLECVIDRLKPAHTICIYDYRGL